MMFGPYTPQYLPDWGYFADIACLLTSRALGVAVALGAETLHKLATRKDCVDMPGNATSWLAALAVCCALAASAYGQAPTLADKLTAAGDRTDDDADRRLLRFVRELAREHQWPEQARRLLASDIVEIAVGRIGPTDKGQTIVILHSPGIVIPGPDMQTVLLIDRSGKVLSSLSCTVSSRVLAVARHEVELRVVPRDRNRDYVVIGLAPADKEHREIRNLSYTVDVDGAISRHPLAGILPEAEADESRIQLELCRVIVSEGKWRLVASRLRDVMP